DGAAGLREGAVHQPALVGEHPQARDLAGDPGGVFGRVLPVDAQQDDESRADLGARLASDGYGRAGGSLDDCLHSMKTRNGLGGLLPDWFLGSLFVLEPMTVMAFVTEPPTFGKLKVYSSCSVAD